MGEPEELVGVDSPPDSHINPPHTRKGLFSHTVYRAAPGEKLLPDTLLAFATYTSAPVDGKASGEESQCSIIVID